MSDFDAYIAKMLQDSAFIHKAIPAVAEDSASYRWDRKPVLKNQLIDTFETDARFSLSGLGQLTVSDERPFKHEKCVRLVTPTALTEKRDDDRGGAYAYTHVSYHCGGMDFRDFNRLSFWVYPDCPGFRNLWTFIVIKNVGEVAAPRSKYFESNHGVNLVVGQWNHVVWEMPYVYRDKVDTIFFVFGNHGSQPHMSDKVTLYYSHLEAQFVEADHYEGWNLDERIAFCHSGYRPGDNKVATTGETDCDAFSVLDAATGQVAFEGKIKSAESDIGNFSLMDFSSLNQCGKFSLRIGSQETKPFYIDAYPFKSAVIKLINFFFLERCGTDNGIHAPCHLDSACQHPLHPALKLPTAGGWHDAGDLSQGHNRTTDAVNAFLAMAEKVKANDYSLYERLMEEARWGLNWLLKTRFGDGYLCEWITQGRWTKNILGDADDIKATASNSPYENFHSAATLAAAAQAFKEYDPILSQYLLKCAEQDFGFAMDGFANARLSDEVVLYGQGAYAAAMLYKAAGKEVYLNQGANMAKVVMECQQAGIPQWEGLLPGMALEGFFYSNRQRTRPFVAAHLSHGHIPVLSLAALCEAAPSHADYEQWHNAVVLFGKYAKAAAKMTQPYALLPGGIYQILEETEANRQRVPGMDQEVSFEDYDRQVRNGLKLADQYYLRRFPVAQRRRGFHGTLLTTAKAASAAARLLKDSELMAVAQKQVEWVLGNNPFAQSTMWGEGYNFAPLYSAFAFDMTGELPVGIQTFENNDKPFYPMANYCTYKEIWVNPASRLLWVLADLY